jgi:error-prone DNA polymerase
VRLGFRQVKGLSEKRMATFIERRGAGYRSVRDVWLRSGLGAGEIERLAKADAFRSLGFDRRAALWDVQALDREGTAGGLPLLERPGFGLADNEPGTVLPPMPAGEHVVQDYRSLGLSLKAHPVSFLRRHLDAAGITPNAHLAAARDGQRLTVAGIVLVRQRPGSGKTIFLTLEDENAIANVIVWNKVFQRYRPVVMGAKLIRAAGRVQSESDVVHIVADRLDDLTPWLGLLSEDAGASRAEAGGKVVLPERWALPKLPADVMPKGRNFH